MAISNNQIFSVKTSFQTDSYNSEMLMLERYQLPYQSFKITNSRIITISLRFNPKSKQAHRSASPKFIATQFIVIQWCPKWLLRGRASSVEEKAEAKTSILSGYVNREEDSHAWWTVIKLMERDKHRQEIFLLSFASSSFV